MWREREKCKSRILKGGYGGASGKERRRKDGYYKDSDGNKVTDQNAIEVA